MTHENDIRRLRYRLNRQGMLELDAWLAPLEKALTEGDAALVTQVEAIVSTSYDELITQICIFRLLSMPKLSCGRLIMTVGSTLEN
jgi:succinate dehydrogenase flavin-adding protein (antitoxin of CptAB toxin-antitoxin module)